MQIARYSYKILMKPKYSRQILEKSSNFMKFLPVGAEFSNGYGRTDRGTDRRTDGET